MNEVNGHYGQPVMLKIDKIINESDDTKTFMFKHKIAYHAGQFVMAWLPGIDEKPFAISSHSNNVFGITVLARGNFTRRLHDMNVGDQVGVRGPFGKGFSIPDSINDGSGNICIIGGGCGMASLTVLTEVLQNSLSKKGNTTIIIGAITKTALLFKNRFKDTTLITDDGSEGIKGYPTDILEDLHKEHKFKTIYTCGPEIMMFKIYEFCKKNNIHFEASLERYMKCGIGICGQCVCDGQMVCKDGPVFDSQALNNMKDFGSYSLLKSGQKVSLKEYGEWRSC